MRLKARLATWLPPLLPLLLSVGVAESAVRLGWVPGYLLPAPSEVIESLIDDRIEFALAAWATTAATAVASLIPMTGRSP